MVVLLVCGYLGVPVACWSILSRARVSGATVGLILAALSLAVISLVTGWVYLPARVDLVTAYARAAAGVIGLGLLLQRRRLGVPAAPAGRPRFRVAAQVLLWTCLAAVLLCCAPARAYADAKLQRRERQGRKINILDYRLRKERPERACDSVDDA